MLDPFQNQHHLNGLILWKYHLSDGSMSLLSKELNGSSLISLFSLKFIILFVSFKLAISLRQHNSSLAIQSTTTFAPPPLTDCHVSMRDMGTEMTPIASQEPSRTESPVRAKSTMHNPTTSQPSTLGKANPESTLTYPPSNILDTTKNELSEKELQMKTKREIMVLGTQLENRCGMDVK
ncbi:hypothetical protein L6164_026336 [Bauhinia variegata]|uniref:Uncharacterized protein n=1 Tax=Bauhinia variegata TaxID=167791 RepID=A0ACB9LPV2_BAUVA|nr:hypothetical protein L6164_026336 [Bauhinia variegata]